MALSTIEKVKIRTALGFPQISHGPLLILGVPAAGQYYYLLERAMDHVLPEAEPRIREVLEEIDCIEAQMSSAKSRLKTSKVDNTTLRSREELEDLEDLFLHWTDVLADMFGIGSNPFSFRHRRMGGSWTVTEPC